MIIYSYIEKEALKEQIEGVGISIILKKKPPGSIIEILYHPEASKINIPPSTNNE